MNKMKKHPKMIFGLQLKILLGFIVTGIISSLVVGYFAYYAISSYENNKVKEKILMVSQLAAETIDGDKHSQLKPGDEDTDTYKELLKDLRDFKGISGLTYLYTFIPKNDTKVQFVLDTDESDEQCAIGDEYDIDDKMVETFKGRPALVDEPYTDEWGTFYSAYAPVYNSKNEVVAIVGSDISLEQVSQTRTS